MGKVKFIITSLALFLLTSCAAGSGKVFFKIQESNTIIYAHDSDERYTCRVNEGLFDEVEIGERFSCPFKDKETKLWVAGGSLGEHSFKPKGR